MTARWVVDEVVPARDLAVTWQPISLYFKNEPEEGYGHDAVPSFNHRLLRVLEAARAKMGDDAVRPLYWEYGRRIHHDETFATRLQSKITPERRVARCRNRICAGNGVDSVGPLLECSQARVGLACSIFDVGSP